MLVSPPHKDRGVSVKKGRIYIAAAAALIAAALCYAVYKALVPTEYRIFTENRVGALEREYNMDLSDAEPERYWVPALARDVHDRFRFGVKDRDDFMENNYFGEIVFGEVSDDNSYAEYKCKPYPGGEYLEFTFIIKFRKERGGYRAELVSCYE